MLEHGKTSVCQLVSPHNGATWIARQQVTMSIICRCTLIPHKYRQYTVFLQPPALGVHAASPFLSYISMTLPTPHFMPSTQKDLKLHECLKPIPAPGPAASAADTVTNINHTQLSAQCIHGTMACVPVVGAHGRNRYFCRNGGCSTVRTSHTASATVTLTRLAGKGIF
jgi:hypothetical protein